MNLNSLKEQNRIIKQRIQQFQMKRAQNDFRSQLDAYQKKLQATVDEMTHKSIIEEESNNKKLHQITQKYEAILKQQIILLTQNKKLSEQKENQTQKLNEEVKKLTKQYEIQIDSYEKKVQINVKKIQQLSGINIIKKLIQNQKFKKFMAQRGCDLKGLQKQSQVEQIASQVDQKQKLIEAAQLKSRCLDGELEKMHQLVLTMKDLMENMQKQKDNILKQNKILKQKLVESEGMIGKLLDKSNQIQEQPQEDEESN